MTLFKHFEKPKIQKHPGVFNTSHYETKNGDMGTYRPSMLNTNTGKVAINVNDIEYTSRWLLPTEYLVALILDLGQHIPYEHKELSIYVQKESLMVAHGDELILSISQNKLPRGAKVWSIQIEQEHEASVFSLFAYIRPHRKRLLRYMIDMMHHSCHDVYTLSSEDLNRLMQTPYHKQPTLQKIAGFPWFYMVAKGDIHAPDVPECELYCI